MINPIKGCQCNQEYSIECLEIDEMCLSGLLYHKFVFIGINEIPAINCINLSEEQVDEFMLDSIVDMVEEVEQEQNYYFSSFPEL